MGKKPGADYSIFCYDDLVIFEFILPLTNEGHLRNSLDALFYKDFVIKKLESVDFQRLENYFGKNGYDSRDAYFEEICDWVSDRFRGYSISQVSGRYRTGDLLHLEDACRFIREGGNYLADETTAIVKFIFPLGAHRPVSELSFEPELDNLSVADLPNIRMEYSKIRFLFFKLFVQNIVDFVTEEDEIWMMESGIRHRLYSWRVVK